MKSQSRLTIPRQLRAGRLAINNTLANPEILALVSTLGYDTTKIQEGQQLYDSAVSAVNNQAVVAGAQRQATLDARAAEQRARESYQVLAQLARAVFVSNPAQRATLGLTSSAPRGTAPFLTRAYILFDNALAVAGVAQVLAQYKYDQSQLSNERAMIAAFDVANQAQVEAIGAKQQATRDQKLALSALKQWMAQYRKVAKIALRAKPQLIEKLGILARNSRTAAQLAAPKKAAATRAAKRAK